MTIPQIIITLSPQGTLQAELPGANGSRRLVPLGNGKRQDIRDEGIEKSLIRMLMSLGQNKAEIGEDGAPTERQVRHWERHWQWPDDRCAFCIAEGKAHRPRSRSGPSQTKQNSAGDGSVKVRILPPRGKHARNATSATLEELGL